MKILLIGVGRWGKNHLRTLKELVEELYVVDSNPERLKLCNEYSIPEDHLSTDYHDFLDKVDGVDIVTPADSHLSIFKDCFRERKDVFVEKPIALTALEAKEIIHKTYENNIILQVGHIYRYHPATSKIKSLIEAKMLGRIQYAYGHFIGFKRPRTDVGVTQTDAIHFFDLFNYIFGEHPMAVMALIKHYLDLSLDDTSISILEYGEKAVLIEAGYKPPERRRDISIIGEKGSIYCDFQKNLLYFYENRHERKGGQWVAIEGEPQKISFNFEEPLMIELKAFLDSIRFRSKPIADGKAGYEALRIVEACYESSATGKKVQIDWEDNL